MLSQFTNHALRIRSWLINLVDGYDDWDISRLGVVDSFNRLRHNTVISRYDQDSDIRHRGTTGPHRSKGRVSRRIQESNLLAAFLDLVSTDVLSNTTCFTCCYARVTQGIQEGCFTMVNVSHDGYNWRTLYQGILVDITFFYEEALNVSCVNFHLLLSFYTVVHHEELNSIAVKRLVLRCHYAHHKELLDNFSWLALDPFCNFCNGHSVCIFKFSWQLMELTFCNRFWCLIIVALSFFIFLVFIPITISLISHLILTASILLLFSWTFFFAIKIIALLIWSSLLLTTRIHSGWRWAWIRCWSRWSWCRLSCCRCFCLRLLLAAVLPFHNFFSFLCLLKAFLAGASVFSILLCFQSCCPSLKVNLRSLRLLAVLTVKSLMILTIAAAILTTIIATVIWTITSISVVAISAILISIIAVLTLALLFVLWFAVALLLPTLCLFLGSRFTLSLKVPALRALDRRYRFWLSSCFCFCLFCLNWRCLFGRSFLR